MCLLTPQSTLSLNFSEQQVDQTTRTAAWLGEMAEKWGPAQDWEMAARRKESQRGREMFGMELPHSVQNSSQADHDRQHLTTMPQVYNSEILVLTWPIQNKTNFQGNRN